MVSSNISDNTTIPIRSNFTDIYGTRSQPDSGIDPDAFSISSNVTDYLLQIGVTPTKNERPPSIVPMPRQKHESSEKVDAELNDLIYARIDEILGPGPLNTSCVPSFSNAMATPMVSAKRYEIWFF